jgi:hypothetical protein
VVDCLSALPGLGQTVEHTLSGIDVIESDVNRLVYLAGTDIFGDFPRSETDLGNLSTVVQSDLVEWHDDCKHKRGQLNSCINTSRFAHILI